MQYIRKSLTDCNNVMIVTKNGAIIKGVVTDSSNSGGHQTLTIIKEPTVTIDGTIIKCKEIKIEAESIEILAKM